MNKEQQTIAAIQKAVPGIIEIKKGCVAKEEIVRSDFVTVVGIDKKEIYLQSNINDSYIFHITKDEFKIRYKEIIGRPITIQDILKTRTDLAIDGLGGIFIRNHCNKKGNLWEMEFVGHYDIDKPFTKQPQKTKDFIGDLILKK